VASDDGPWAVDRVITWWRRLERERASLLIVVFGGLQAFLVVAFATRGLSEAAAATFLVAWSALNTLLLAVYLPTESIAAAMATGVDDSDPGTDTGRAFVVEFYPWSWLAVAIASPAVVALFSGDHSMPVLASAALLGVAYGGYSFLRSISFSTDNLPRAAVLSGATLGAWIVLAAACWRWLPLTVATVIGTVAIAHLLATLWVLWRWNRSGGIRPLRRPATTVESRRRELSRYLHVATSGLTMMLPQTIGLLLAARIGVPAAVIVSYGGAVVLARGLFLALGALPTSFTVRYSIYRSEGQYQAYRQLYRWHLGMLVAAVIFATIAAALLGGAVIAFYTGEPMALSSLGLAIVVLAEGLFAAATAPRMILIVEHKVAAMNGLWALAAVISVVVMLTPVDPTLRILAAPLLAGLFICITLFPLARRAAPALRKVSALPS
jgi:hypothetical protein